MTDQPIIENPLEDEAISALFNEDGANFHTILEVWRAILTPALNERHTRITPQWASRICNKFQQMTFADMPLFRDKYFDRVETLLSLLSAEIDTDPECLQQSTPEEDVKHNSMHYLNVLTDWQVTMLGWELDWDCAAPDAAVDLASFAEVHEMFFGQTGLAALLDQIRFEFTDMHRDALALALQDYKNRREG